MTQLIYVLIALAITAVYGDEPEKLVDGEPTSIENYPHCISMRINNNHMCGGSIIHEQYILTAAHCVAPLIEDAKLRKALTIVAGTTHLNKGGDKYTVEKLWYHENYNPRALGRSPYDIGLIKLSIPIKLGPTQKPINLPTTNVKENDIVTIAAWGSTGYGKPIHNNLQKLTAKAMLSAECQKYHKFLMKIHKNELCTLIQKGTGLCHGDSGSGLIKGTTIVGLVSGGRPCAMGYPDVYSAVMPYNNWINEKMNE